MGRDFGFFESDEVAVATEAEKTDFADEASGRAGSLASETWALELLMTALLFENPFQSAVADVLEPQNSKSDLKKVDSSPTEIFLWKILLLLIEFFAIPIG